MEESSSEIAATLTRDQLDQVNNTLAEKDNEINNLNTKIYKLLNQLNGESDMAGPQCKIYFANNDEREIMTYYARMHGLSLTQFILQSARKTAKEISDMMAENAKAAASEQAEQPAQETEETEDVSLEEK